MLRGMLAAGLTLAATGLVMAAGPAAQADQRAPYARAAAIVSADGTLTYGKNVIRSWRAGLGRYCVQVAPRVDVTDSLMQVNSREALRLAHVVYGSTSPVYRHPSPGYGNPSPVQRNPSPIYRSPSQGTRHIPPGHRHTPPGHRHTPPGHRHTPPVYGSPWSTCGQDNTVTVNVYHPSTGRLADGSFDLVIA
ncbi:hypothetical protein EDD27_1213 [Nonomuraea polychroma]|uniref:Peptidase inhibitor family I36 n=1 Tax=Nonomuraea polychroma TaxID=46176 RepID=A0A438LZA9_9ACTN|nr:hypothetical protein [Nonomuraea polychroma]RVX38885.1 hypothetical protein EDD27_1213 [Nonomuraea polychroma]